MSTAIRPRAMDADVNLSRVLLDGKRFDADVLASVTAADLERTMDGASILSFNLHDPQLVLLRSGIFNDRVIVTLDGLRFQLAGVAKQGNTTVLTFEDFEVAQLRKYSKPRKAARDQITRAQFVLSMVREVRSPRIKFYSPEMNKRQPIGRSTDKLDQADKDANREPGFSAGARFTVKGVPATRQQVAIADRALDVARTHDAPRLAQLALIAAGIQESLLGNPTGGDSSSVGFLQLLDSHLGGSVSTNGGRRDIELVTKLFLTQGFTGKGGAISIARKNPNMDPAVIAATVQGNAGGSRDYAPWRQEATRIVDLYNGGDGTLPISDVDSGTLGKYEFTRGQPDQPENTWEAAKRLAEEVNWRCFMVAGTLYFVSDAYLMRSRPLMTINRDTPGIVDIDFNLDVGKPVQTLTVPCRIDRWSAPPGSVVVVEKMGPADGRWLVQSIRRSLFSADGTIELRRPVAALPEPPAETVSTVGSSVGDGDVESLSAFGGGQPVYSSASPVSGGQGGDWAGAKPVAEALAAIVSPPTRVSSTKRATQNTANGNVSDHYQGNTTAYACDCACSLAEGDRVIGKLGEALGVTGFKGGYILNKTITVEGRRYRVQVLWRVEDHYDHIHIGVKLA